MLLLIFILIEMSKSKVVQKNLRFPQAVVEVIEKEGEKLGFNFNEYVRYIVTKKAEEAMIDMEELERIIIESDKLSKEGKLPTFNSAKEIEAYLKSLDEEDGKVQN
jgi:hypothetical protein